MTIASARPKYSTPKLYPRSEGAAVALFGSTFLTISKGVQAGHPLHVTDWQADLLDSVYERRDDGLYRYKRTLIGLSRKAGKSLLGSLIGLYGLVEGEPGAEVYSAAGDRQQARIVFGEARRQVLESDALSKTCRVYRDAIEVPETGAIYRVLAADSKLVQGLNPSTVVCDELHVVHEDLWDALTLGSGARRDPMVVAITTAGYDLESICGRLYQYGKRVAEGEIDDEAFGFFWWEAPEGCDVNDEAAWAAANPNLPLGLISSEDFAVAARQTAEVAFRRYRLNQWVRSQESWLPSGAWQACTDATLQLVDDAPTFVGIDMALKHDSIAVVLVQTQGDRAVVRAQIWLQDGNAVDVQAVEQYLRKAAVQYNLIEVAYDPAYMQRSAEILADDGLPMVEFPQSSSRMVPACGHLYEMIVNGLIAHEDNPVFTDQVLSATPRSTDAGWRLSKGKSKRKIDAAIALAMAVDRATRKQEVESAPGFYAF
jgi:phage terminase large subunit-like protein